MKTIGLEGLTFLSFMVAATLEVFGDAWVRKFLDPEVQTHERWNFLVYGLIALCSYGFIVNGGIALKIIDWKFSKQLGTYVMFFAIASTFIGTKYFGETVSGLHYLGLGLVVLGGLIIRLANT